jgi:hypothetical protein
MGLLIAALLVSSCGGAPDATPSITPGTAGQPRDVNIIARDYEFEPPVLDLVPGETVILHVINGGLVVHEAILGDQRVQDAWEIAEAAAADPPPGPTPLVSVPPGVSGVRIVVSSGARVDVRWTVPAGPPGAASGPESGPASARAGGSQGTSSADAPADGEAAGSIPLVATGTYSGLIVGCHIGGHYARGMHVPIRFVAPGT